MVSPLPGTLLRDNLHICLPLQPLTAGSDTLCLTLPPQMTGQHPAQRSAISDGCYQTRET